MYNLTKSQAKIRQDIERYKKALQKEQRTFGAIDDGPGRRYMIGIFYVALGDIDGALRHYRWFQKRFSDDTGEPFQYLCWTLALYRKGKIKLAEDKLIQTTMQNLYLFPHLFGEEQKTLDIWHASNWAQKDYLDDAPVGLFDLWSKEEIDWAKEVYYRERASTIRKRYIEIYHQLQNESPGPKRSALVKEAFKLEELEMDLTK